MARRSRSLMLSVTSGSLFKDPAPAAPLPTMDNGRNIFGSTGDTLGNGFHCIVTLAQIHIISLMTSIFKAYIKMVAGADLPYQIFRHHQLHAGYKLFSRTWWSRETTRGTAELICKSYSVLCGEIKPQLSYKVL